MERSKRPTIGDTWWDKFKTRRRLKRAKPQHVQAIQQGRIWTEWTKRAFFDPMPLSPSLGGNPSAHARRAAQYKAAQLEALARKAARYAAHNAASPEVQYFRRYVASQRRS